MSSQYPPPSPPPPGYGNPYGAPPNAPLSMPPGSSGPGGKTSIGLDSNVSGMLCYLGNILCCVGVILSIVFLITEKDNRFVRFHAAQALLLAAAAIVTSIVLSIFGIVLSMAHLGILVLGLRLIVGVVFLALWIIAGIKAYQGERYKLPVIGDVAENMSN